MSVFQSIILGLVQGIAEFLPISSSGHLTLLQKIMGLEEVPLLFDVFLHLATLLAVVLFFRKKIWELLKAFGRMIAHRPYQKEGLSKEECLAVDKNYRRYILAIILATIITGCLGLVTSKIIPDLPIIYVCIGFIITAILLILSSFIEKIQAKKSSAKSSSKESSVEEKSLSPSEKAPSWWQALLIGLAQGIGTLPGISRSGSTIAGSLFCGVNRQQAGEFSFICSIPAILGAFLLELKDLGQVSSSVGAMPLATGCIVAFVSGFLSLTWLMRLIKKGRLEWFACYLIPLAVLGIIFLG